MPMPSLMRAILTARTSAGMLLGAIAFGAGIGGACADRGSGQDIGLVTRDSSGIEIAELQGDPWRAPPWAVLDTASVLRIAPDEMRPETLFGRVRGTLRLSNGNIAVLDIQRHRILIFAQDGSLVRALGRQGQGPGELAVPWKLVRAPADTLGVYDMAGHIELLALADGGSRRLRVPANRDGGAAQILGSFPTGGYLALVNEFSGKLVPGRNPLFSTMHVLSADGVVGPPLARYASAQFTFKDDGDGRLRQVEDLFWAEPGMAVLPAGFVWCLATEFDCEIRSDTGEHLRTIRASVATRDVTNADVEELLDIRLKGARTMADTARERAGIAESERMVRFPVLSVIRTDSRSRIWMRAYVWRPSDREVRWLVFEPTGKVLGTVQTPANLQVFDIGDDYVLGVDRDEDDAERVVMYRLSRG